MSSAKHDREEQFIEEKSETEKIVRNSPYGTERAALGWGTPFKQPQKCFFPEMPHVHIGMSSLNAVPSVGKSRDMDKLVSQYMKKFNCLEHCNPYHRMGTPEDWKKWKGLPGKKPFLYTIKANQYLTHTRMMEVDADTADHVKNFFVDRCQNIMGDHLGAVLLQLPPQFKMSPSHLDRIKGIGALIAPSGVKVAIEFRDKSWYCEEVFEALRALKWALVVTHTFGVGETPTVDTGAGFMYVRLHGAVGRYVGDYGAAVMQQWADRIRSFQTKYPDGKVFFFLNNNESAVSGLTSSVCDCTALAKALQAGPTDATTASTAAAAAPSNAQPPKTDADVIVDDGEEEDRGPRRREPPKGNDLSAPLASARKSGGAPPANVEVIDLDE